ncbi:6-O-methylguanine DNA methyltransferase [Boletus edulis]|nr:6-O-methylguanine DNA methyltransferase [Boletus edulis]
MTERPKARSTGPSTIRLSHFARTIPCGRVTTYGVFCLALGMGSPRSVGSALRHNPFAPFVPCHRVIGSNLYIGGFFGE